MLYRTKNGYAVVKTDLTRAAGAAMALAGLVLLVV